MLTFAVAVEEGHTAKAVEDSSPKPTTWVRVVLFGEKADDLAATLAKSDRVHCEGRLSLDHWVANDGTERHGLSVVATLVQPLGKIGKRRLR
ncbi:MAG: hypothetical protein FD153_1282 [Rhodospirillaceae bacterium]|nr:MAG: hypothetical protein FD153_1282 [Rhodospirillaceae bacterium]